jgi:chromosome segregation protein
LRRQRAELEQQLEQLQPAFEAALEQSRQHELEQTRAQYELENLRAQLQQLRNRLQQLAQRWEALERDSLQAEELLERQRQQQQELQQQLQQREHEYAELYQQYSQSLAELEQCAAELQRSQRQHEALLEQLHTLSQRLHQVELEQQHARLQADHAAGQLSEQFGLLPEQVELPAPPPSAEQLQQRIRTYSRRLASLGTVNFRALEEFEEHSQRLQFLESQWRDLREAERALLQAIEQAQQAAVERFRQTFEQVRRNFQRLFRLLFEDGDEADIRLTGEQVLEADIEIVAKPRGKRPQSIEQLSGGEKTLVAIAFLFALYLVKPSPFCILDELDAPLDDANIERFMRMLRSFEESTQFVLITHNRRTMEAVDALYGVTTQPEGVSKVVAVRLRAPASV